MSHLMRRRTLLAAGLALPFLNIGGAFAEDGKSLRIGLSTFPTKLEPWSNPGNAAGLAIQLIHRGLLSFDENGALRGEIAKSWAVDGSDWIFHLGDARFSDGTLITAADVKWNLERVAAPDSTAYMSAQFKAVAAIEAQDDKTVRLRLDKPVVNIPQWLATFYMPIVKPGTEADGQDVIGAGPFVLDAVERGISMHFRASLAYYKQGLPMLQSIDLITYADENLRMAALETGDVDFVDFVPPQAMDGVEANAELALASTDGPFMYLTFNGSSGPFADARVRQAVAFAVKREDVVQSGLFGRGSPLTGMPIPPSSEFYDAERAGFWQRDLDKAKTLLAEAGYPDGFDCTLDSIGSQYRMHESTAVVVQQALAEVGIRATLNLTDLATRVARGNAGQFEFAVAGSALESNDPDSLSALIDGTLSPSYVRSPGIDIPGMAELLSAGRAEYDLEKRKAIYAQVEDLALEHTPFVGLAWRAQAYALRDVVTGFTNIPGALTFHSGVTLESTTVG